MRLFSKAPPLEAKLDSSSSKQRRANRTHVITILMKAKQKIERLNAHVYNVPTSSKSNLKLIHKSKTTINEDYIEVFNKNKIATLECLDLLAKGLQLMNDASNTISPNKKHTVMNQAKKAFENSEAIAKAVLTLILKAKCQDEGFACQPLIIELIALLNDLFSDQHLFYRFRNEGNMLRKGGGTITDAIKIAHHDIEEKYRPCKLTKSKHDQFVTLHSDAVTQPDCITIEDKAHIKEHLEFNISVIIRNLSDALYFNALCLESTLTGFVENLACLQALCELQQSPKSEPHKAKFLATYKKLHRSQWKDQLALSTITIDSKLSEEEQTKGIMLKLEQKDSQKDLRERTEYILATKTVIAGLYMEVQDWAKDPTAALAQVTRQRDQLVSLINSTLLPVAQYGSAAIGKQFQYHHIVDYNTRESELRDAGTSCNILDINSYYNNDATTTSEAKALSAAADSGEDSDDNEDTLTSLSY